MPYHQEPCAHKPGEEAVGRIELAAIVHGAAQHAAQHVLAPLVAGLRAVGNGERQHADVVGDDAVGHVAVGRFALRPDLRGVARRGLIVGLVQLRASTPSGTEIHVTLIRWPRVAP